MTPAHLHAPDHEATAEADFFVGLKRPACLEHESFDLYTPDPSEPKPAVIFVHGGPIPEDQTPRPRHWAMFTGYGALAASQGLAGVTFDHRLHTTEHYPVSANDISVVVDQVRQLPQVDPHRIVLWFFSGAGRLDADWLRTRPSWLRAIAWTYPVLSPPPNWPGDRPRFDCTTAITDAPQLPKLLVRVDDDYPSFSETQTAVIEAAQASNSTLDTIQIPEASHGYENHGYQETNRQLTAEAMSWVAEVVSPME